MTGGWDRLTPEGEKFFRQIDELQDKEVFVGFRLARSQTTGALIWLK